jgi:hypothetical protein
MKRVSILALSVLLLAAGVLPAAAIVGGELDGDTHPNIGLMIADIDGEPVWRCSGTLIAPRVFLTAGHCTGDGATAARVWFDSDLTGNTEYPYGGETSYEGTPVPHPLYLWGGDDPHDVGLVILTEPLDVDIEPATLTTPALLTQLKKDRVLEGGYEDGVYFRSVGYGGDLESWPPPLLTYVKVRKFSESEYVSLTKVHLHLSQKAVFDEEGSCFGDSGGPVFYVDPAGNEILVAVTSSGDGMCVATGFNYRVDQPYMLDWIYEQIELAE